MNRLKAIREALTALFLGVSIALVVCLVIFVLQCTKTVSQLQVTGQSVNAFFANTDRQLNGTPVQHGTDGAIFSAKKAIDDVRAGAVIASRQETTYYRSLQTNTDLIASKLNSNLEELHSTLANVNSSQAMIAKDAHDTLLNVNTALVGLPALVGEGTSTLKTANALIGDKSIPATLRHIAETSEHVDEITGNGVKISGSFAAMAEDGRLGFHKWLNPSKKSVVFGYLWKGSLIWGSRFVP